MDKDAEVKIVKFFDYLAMRWEDESEYEEWQGYVTAMKTKLAECGLAFVRFTCKPFRLECKDGGYKLVLAVKRGAIEVKRYA